jgi:hypothetical protein
MNCDAVLPYGAVATKRMGRMRMKTPYDIFKKERNGSMRWLGHTADLHTAEACIAQLREHSPGEYFVFDESARRLRDDPGVPPSQHK